MNDRKWYRLVGSSFQVFDIRVSMSLALPRLGWGERDGVAHRTVKPSMEHSWGGGGMFPCSFLLREVEIVAALWVSVPRL